MITLLLRFTTSLIVINSVICQATLFDTEPAPDYDCDAPKDLPAQIPFPDIYLRQDPMTPIPEGYEITFELNKRSEGDIGRSQFSTEQISTARRTGYIELQYSGQDESKEEVYYFQPLFGNRESFTIKNTQCSANTQSMVVNAYDRTAWFPKAVLEQAYISKLDSWPSLAPSMMFVKSFHNGNKMNYVGQVSLNGYERINVWKMCLSRLYKKNSILKFYFLDSSHREGERPMRIEVFTEGEETWVYTVGSFTQLPSVSTPVPIGFGCQRLVLPTTPVVKPNVPLEKATKIEMELILESLFNGEFSDETTAAIYSVNVVRSIEQNVVSFTQTFLNINEIESSIPSALRYPLRKVIDLDEAIQYETNLLNPQCKTSNLLGDSNIEGKSKYETSFEFHFSDGSGFNIMDNELWSVGDYLNYVGTGTERGLSVTVWESELEDKFFDTQGKARNIVVTRMHLMNNTLFDSGYLIEGAPVKTVIKIRSEDRLTFDQQIVLNGHNYQTGPLDTKEQEAFNVNNCFLKSDQSTWFQVLYPVEDSILMKLQSQAETVEKAFRKQLSSMPTYRLSNIVVDVDANFIIVSAKLLERAPLDFKEIKYMKKDNIAIKADIPSPQIVVENTDNVNECATECEESDQCIAFSWCKTQDCVIFNAKTNGEYVPMTATPVADNCSAYELKNIWDINDNKKWNQMSSKTLIKKMQAMVANRELQLEIELSGEDGKSEVISITPVELLVDV